MNFKQLSKVRDARVKFEPNPFRGGQKSFYGKAELLGNEETGDVILLSYGTPVALFRANEDKVYFYPAWDYSQTTLKHVKEFLYSVTNDMGDMTKSEIAKYIKENNALIQQ